MIAGVSLPLGRGGVTDARRRPSSPVLIGAGVTFCLLSAKLACTALDFSDATVSDDDNGLEMLPRGIMLLFLLPTDESLAGVECFTRGSSAVLLLLGLLPSARFVNLDLWRFCSNWRGKGGCPNIPISDTVHLRFGVAHADVYGFDGCSRQERWGAFEIVLLLESEGHLMGKAGVSCAFNEDFRHVQGTIDGRWVKRACWHSGSMNAYFFFIDSYAINSGSLLS